MPFTASHVEAMIPATTRGIGFAVQTSFDTANALYPDAAKNSKVNIFCAYRIALLQMQAQQQQAGPNVGEELSIIQTEELTQEQLVAVKSVPQNFVNTASIIESFGRIKFINRSFRTFQSPHLSETIGELSQLLPNPYSVTITSLRLVVEALADNRTPVAQRKYFIARSVIPGARFKKNILENPNDVIPARYFDNVYRDDLRRWRTFIGACQRKMATLIRSLSLNGEATTAALVSLSSSIESSLHGNPPCLPGHFDLCCYEMLNKRKLMLGGYSLTGETPDRADNVRIQRSGYEFRETLFQRVEIGFDWGAVDNLLLTNSTNMFNNIADQFDSISSSIPFTPSHVGAVIPATTRGIGFAVQTSFNEANIKCPEAAKNSEVDIFCAYRIALLQMQAQQQQGNFLTRDFLKAGVEPPTILSQDQLDEVKSAPQNFVNTATIIESFGRIKFKNKSFRTFQSPHLSKNIGELSQLLPNPYSVTITSLRLVVEALADERTPVAQRKYFIARSSIPGARFENDLLKNPDDVIPAGYFDNHVYRDDFRRWKSFMETYQRRMAAPIRPISLSGEATPSALVSVHWSSIESSLDGNKVPHLPGYFHPYYYETLTTQQLKFGGYSLTGETPDRADNVQIERSGYGIREPSFQAKGMKLHWKTVGKKMLTESVQKTT